MVTAVVEGKDPRREIRVAQYPIEVEHRVIFAARAEPGIERLALDFLRRREDRERCSRHEKPFNRIQGAAVDFESQCMRTFNELPVTLDDLTDGDLLGGIECKDVVIPHSDDDMCYPGLAQSVALKPRQ